MISFREFKNNNQNILSEKITKSNIEDYNWAQKHAVNGAEIYDDNENKVNYWHIWSPKQDDLIGKIAKNKNISKDIDKTVDFSRIKNYALDISKNVSIGAKTKIDCDKITIEKNVVIGKSCEFLAASYIHENVKIGDKCVFKATIIIGKNCVIGKGCVFVDPIKVPDNAIIPNNTKVDDGYVF